MRRSHVPLILCVCVDGKVSEYCENKGHIEIFISRIVLEKKKM